MEENRQRLLLGQGGDCATGVSDYIYRVRCSVPRVTSQDPSTGGGEGGWGGAGNGGRRGGLTGGA